MRRPSSGDRSEPSWTIRTVILKIRSASLAFLQDDVPHRHQGVGLESLGGWPQANYQALLARASALQEGIFVVQRLPGEIHLRHQTVALAGDVEMNMGSSGAGLCSLGCV